MLLLTMVGVLIVLVAMVTSSVTGNEAVTCRRLRERRCRRRAQYFQLPLTAAITGASADRSRTRVFGDVS